jgi:secreted trypsin-like serine protease
MKHFVVLASLFVVVACAQQKNSISGNFTAGIINGQTVQSGDPIANHLVAITDNKWENCTGTLIAKNLVLTAAHCETKGEAMYVAFGLEVSEGNLDQVERRQVTNYRLIPGVEKALGRREADWKDLMIVEFEGEAPAGYVPAKFLEDTSILQDGQMVIFAGYGVTNGHSQKGDGTLRKTQAPIKDAGFSETEIQTDERRTGTCNIDSGGPAFVQVGGELFFWGVTSRGADNCNKDGVYTRIDSYREWVNGVIKDLGAQ